MRYIFGLFLANIIHAQHSPNLLLNASLEQHTCTAIHFECLQNIHQANGGSCDLYKNGESYYPHGYTQAQDGEFCIGALALYPNGLREYPLLELREPLDTAQLYEFSVWIYLAAQSGCALSTLQLIGLQDSTTAPNAEHLQTRADTVHIQPPTNANHWQRVICQFRPRKTWHYLSIGNVLPNSKTHVLPLKISAFGGQKPQVYYYYDNFELKSLGDVGGERQTRNK